MKKTYINIERVKRRYGGETTEQAWSLSFLLGEVRQPAELKHVQNSSHIQEHCVWIKDILATKIFLRPTGIIL